MLVHKDFCDEEQYIAMLLILNGARQVGYSVKISYVRENLQRITAAREVSWILDHLSGAGLVYLATKSMKPTEEVKADGYVGLSYEGLAFLINYANEFLGRIKDKFDEVPEKLISTLVGFIDLAQVPAADRYVNTTDNLPEFQKLARELEIIRDAILRDQNANELPIPDKKAVVSDVEGMIAQIKNGSVRLSDLATRIRPLVKNLAETCKDFAIIAGAASGAYLAITNILSKLF